MEFTYSFGYPNVQRIMAITEAVNNSQTGEKYQIDYRGKYRPLPVIEVPIELLVYRIENIRTKSLQKQWLALHRDQPRDLFTSDPFSIEAQETQHQVLKMLVDKENLLKTFKDNDKLQQTEPLICSNDGIVVNGNRRLCAWRELYYNNKNKYAHFQTIRVAVLPDSDPQGMYDLEVALQIHSDMKAEYVWHAIAADYQEKFDSGMDIGVLAAKQNKKPEEINTYIECYNYAAQYLESIGHPDEWMLVDKQEYAFKQIVIGRKNISNPGDKELFQEISKAMLQTPAVGDRLYKQIPKVVSGLAVIAPKLQEVFGITVQSSDDDDLALLTGGDTSSENTTNSQIAAGIRMADNPTLVAQTVKSVLDTTDELEKEKKKKSFVFDQVMKAATQLACFVPVMQWHSEPDGGQFRELMPGGEGNNERSPWNLAAAYGVPEFVDEMRFWHNLRMNLLPYLYSSALDCVETSSPMMRPLVFQWPEDPEAWNCEDEFLLGDSLLVAPLLKENSETRPVYLPKGNWISLFDRHTVSGGQTITAGGAGKLPVFLRVGYGLPLRLDEHLTLGSPVGNQTAAGAPLHFLLAGNCGQCRFRDEAGTDVSLTWEDGRVCIKGDHHFPLTWEVIQTEA